jgi:threonine/homoserine/homoserine lactone efflux protein
MWFAAPEDSAEPLPPQAQSALKLFFTRMTVTLGNPKIMMFYMALLPSRIDIGAVTVAGWAQLVATMLLVLIAIDISWALLS